ncbi:MAG: hypothetical protein ACRCU5_15460 [Rhizobiaceae bacterium]
MDYKSRSNAVRAEARNKILELRNERLAKKGLLVPASQVTALPPVIEPTPISEFVGSPELVNALKGVVAEPEHQPIATVAKSSKKSVKPAAPKKAKPMQKRDSETLAIAEKPAFIAVIAKTEAESSAELAVEPTIAVTPESAIDVASAPEVVPVAASVAEVEQAPAVEKPVVQPSQPMQSQELAPASAQQHNPIQAPAPAQEPVGALQASIEHALKAQPLPAPVAAAPLPVDPQPTVGSKFSLGPVSDDISPFSLERLPMIGPGLVWHLQKAGVHSLDDLAYEDVDGLIQRLGAISELMRLTDWIRLAKDQDRKAG